MTPFTTLSQAIQIKLESLASFAGVVLVQEDDGDVPTMIEKEIGRVGMGALLGVPDFVNEDATLANVINAKIKIQILFIEVPSLWRTDNSKPHCADLGQSSGAALQGLVVDGFEPLRVLNGQRVVDKEIGPLGLYWLEIETMQIFDAS